ncbi:MAG: hypothetical protein KDD41_01900 [Flavobacteriales bacterium]|nr:hypothetical protein [Flavobacteriales bacterium]
MKKILVSLITLFSLASAHAQNTTTGTTDDAGNGYKSAVLIIPFESKMYFSDIDRDLSQKTEMNFHEIKAKFKAALDQNIYIALKQYYSPQSFYMMEQDEALKELSYIYNSIGFKYEVVPEEEVVEKETTGKKLLGKFKKKEKEEEYIDAGVNNGQIVSQVDNREKYMKTQITNENLLPNLDQKYKASYYLFINQLDIKRSADMAYLATDEAYKREIKVHYTIIDSKGEIASTGAIKSRFSSTQNDIDKIIKEHFPLIAERMVNNLLGPDQAHVE